MMSNENPAWISEWNPEDETFWNSKGKFIARRNLIWSIVAEHIGFSVWAIWSIVAAKLPAAGFHYSTDQLFQLVGDIDHYPEFVPWLTSMRTWNAHEIEPGVNCIDAEAGATAHHEGEASINHLMTRRAEKVVVVADSSKAGKRTFARICAAEDVNVLVTDAGIEQDQAGRLAEAGVEVVIA